MFLKLLPNNARSEIKIVNFTLTEFPGFTVASPYEVMWQYDINISIFPQAIILSHANTMCYEVHDEQAEKDKRQKKR